MAKPQIWLPIKEETTGREMILYIPGASHLDRHQLQDILDKEKEVMLADMKAQGPILERIYSRKEVGQALKEFRASLARRRETGNRRYF